MQRDGIWITVAAGVLRVDLTEHLMSFRSVFRAVGLFVFSGAICGGCAHEKPPAAGDVIVRSDHPPDTKTGMLPAPADGEYACYKEGLSEPLGDTVTLKKG